MIDIQRVSLSLSSVGELKWWKYTTFILVDHDVKISDAYYHIMMLLQLFVPAKAAIH